MIVHPFGFLCHKYYSLSLEKVVKRTEETYQQAGAIAEQALSNIKTVKLYDAEAKEVKRYWAQLSSVSKTWRLTVLAALCSGMLWIVVFSGFASTLYVGAKVSADRLRDNCSSPTFGREMRGFAKVYVVR
jgi:ABC-type multidrug transport system fused ATPase/permease subunit